MGSRQIVLVSTAGISVLYAGIFWRQAKTKRLFSQCSPHLSLAQAHCCSGLFAAFYSWCKQSSMPPLSSEEGGRGAGGQNYLEHGLFLVIILYVYPISNTWHPFLKKYNSVLFGEWLIIWGIFMLRECMKKIYNIEYNPGIYTCWKLHTQGFSGILLYCRLTSRVFYLCVLLVF